MKYDKLKYLKQFAMFAVVAEESSFTQAADRLGLGKAHVSDQIQRLEKILNVQLLNRSTRSVTLTTAGKRLLSRCQQLNQLGEEIFQLVENSKHIPTGRLRVTAKNDMCLELLPEIIHKFESTYSDVSIDLIASDELADLERNNIDVAVRIGLTKDWPYYGSHITEAEAVIVASRDYINSVGQPTSLEELAKMDWITLSSMANFQWLLTGPDGKQNEISIKEKASTNSSAVAYQMMKSGLGITATPEVIAKTDIINGSIIRLLPDYRLPKIHVYALYSERYPAAKIKVFINFIREQLRPLFK
ncbi:LysR family transcriptional regulator [Endozoicomonas sp. SM1973]|uniref:LysR family transcriptional regulator n=1 Tax=Spartinivicinus marinus TaxID=2994442 RepID=A0A853I1R0_9GAMM|nr:LysR family transcriptional regulator [Spartinivicinus marinus]MCX4026242.1 LysR family transcriptional regulator [Spartinivicinus marinus]NYZ67343.1 LysR family transcriptional regulator [Spartinivicinus marinus]